jgi:hypothetical protein
MSVGIEVIHWPDSHDDSAIIQVNFSCEKNCLFTTIILSENLENQSERVFDLTIEPHEGEFEAVLRIEHLSSWAEKRVTFYWPAAPVDVEDPGTQIDENTSSDQLDEGDENTIETESWKSSQTVNYLLAILIIIGITMTIGSILRNTRIRGGGLNQQRMWHDPSTISTREVERELSKTPNLTPIDSDSELTDE